MLFNCFYIIIIYHCDLLMLLLIFTYFYFYLSLFPLSCIVAAKWLVGNWAQQYNNCIVLFCTQQYNNCTVVYLYNKILVMKYLVVKVIVIVILWSPCSRYPTSTCTTACWCWPTPSTGSWKTGSGTAWPASTASRRPPSPGTEAGPCWRPSRR